MRIAVCDDAEAYVNMMRNVAKAECEKMGIVCEIDAFNDGEDVLKAVKKVDYDLIFLDIQMPKVGGFTVAREIYRETGGENLVFISSFEMLACESVEFRPFGFVRKRCFDDDMDKVFKRWNNRRREKRYVSFKFGKDKEEITIRTDDIKYIKANGHYVIFCTKDKEYEERAYISKYDYLTEYMEFVKCNRSVICNLKHCFNIVNDQIVFNDMDKVTISRDRVTSVWSKYNGYNIFEYGDD